ncbi:putative ATP-grasp-modified RiPP [Saccharothrix sp. AJ9571]|nr:putative ATP-grasp-modified RiPP [Saccharothrix sp. AJ9571]
MPSTPALERAELVTTEPLRFYDDPLAPVSAQFPLTRPGLAEVDSIEGPSGPDTRPFGLRHVRPLPAPKVPAYTYSHVQQVSVAPDGSEQPMVELTPNAEWSSITDNDGDEGASEDWGNDFHQDHPVRA